MRNPGELLYTTLTPNQENVQFIGESRPIASRRPLGGGYIITLAVEPSTGGIVRNEGYRETWHLASTIRHTSSAINFDSATEIFSESVPSLADIELSPVSSVVMYLFLYFIVAVFLNWAFWHRMKRREMAWVTLVVLSICFTTYAMFFGTQGRARSSEFEVYEILEVASQSDLARRNTMTAILAGGSGRFNGTLANPYARVWDLSIDYQYMLEQQPYNNSFINNSTTPFNFIDQENPALENIYIGASDYRLMRITDYTPMEGAITGYVQQSEDGVYIEIEDNTGFSYSRSPKVLYQGLLLQLEMNENIYTARISKDRFEALYTQAANQANDLAGQRWRLRYEKVNQNTFAQQFQHALCSGDSIGSFYGNYGGLNHALGPMMVAWVERPVEAPLNLDKPITVNSSGTILFADLDVRSLPIESGKKQSLTAFLKPSNLDYRRNYAMTNTLAFNETGLLSIQRDPWMTPDSTRINLAMTAKLNNISDTLEELHLYVATTEEIDGKAIADKGNKLVLTREGNTWSGTTELQNWNKYTDDSPKFITLHVFLTHENQETSFQYQRGELYNNPFNFSIEATGIQTATNQGVALAWQS